MSDKANHSQVKDGLQACILISQENHYINSAQKPAWIKNELLLESPGGCGEVESDLAKTVRGFDCRGQAA